MRSSYVCRIRSIQTCPMKSTTFSIRKQLWRALKQAKGKPQWNQWRSKFLSEARKSCNRTQKCYNKKPQYQPARREKNLAVGDKLHLRAKRRDKNLHLQKLAVADAGLCHVIKVKAKKVLIKWDGKTVELIRYNRVTTTSSPRTTIELTYSTRQMRCEEFTSKRFQLVSFLYSARQ